MSRELILIPKLEYDELVKNKELLKHKTSVTNEKELEKQPYQNNVLGNFKPSDREQKKIFARKKLKTMKKEN